jgi:hypothetical protein
MNLADKIIDYYANLHFEGSLPEDISIMNPYKESDQIKIIANKFYEKFYKDNKKRTLIFGINPGRLGAGSTGIPFTDTKRMIEFCGIEIKEMHTHEPSSVFIYEMIQAYGGPKSFYGKFYINSLFPLGFTKYNSKSKKDVNFNYYDSKELIELTTAFIVWNIQTQINLGCHTHKCYCLGTGKNYQFFKSLNEKHKFFNNILPLDHPRFIMQYKQKEKNQYIQKYLSYLSDN